METDIQTRWKFMEIQGMNIQRLHELLDRTNLEEKHSRMMSSILHEGSQRVSTYKSQRWDYLFVLVQGICILFGTF
jgi:hypothetical protein